MTARFATRAWSAVALLASPLAKRAERHFLSRSTTGPIQHEPVFIVGAPRTGSTILYQAMSNCFDVGYIDNLVCAWRRSILAGFALSRLLFADRPHGNFSSHHGDTSGFGLHAPSECGAFWYQWLPRDRHFIDHQDCTPDIVAGIAGVVGAATNYIQKPIVFKNLNAGQRLRLVRRCFPGARIIHVKRDKQALVESIARARRRAGVGEGQWWSVMPRGHERLLGLPEREMIERQVELVDAQIVEDLSLFPAANHRTVDGGALSADVVLELGDWLHFSKRRGGWLPDFDKPPRKMAREH